MRSPRSCYACGPQNKKSQKGVILLGLPQVQSQKITPAVSIVSSWLPNVAGCLHCAIGIWWIRILDTFLLWDLLFFARESRRQVDRAAIVPWSSKKSISLTTSHWQLHDAMVYRLFCDCFVYVPCFALLYLQIAFFGVNKWMISFTQLSTSSFLEDHALYVVLMDLFFSCSWRWYATRNVL